MTTTLTPMTKPPSRLRQSDSRLTPGGAALLAERIADIRERRLPELRPHLMGIDRDERMMAEFERLTEEAAAIEAALAESSILTDDPEGFDGRISIGMRVHVTLADGSTAWVRPVHPVEAFLDDERISILSPLGWVLLGARVDHLVWVASPSGVWGARVLDVDPRVTDEPPMI